MQAGSAARPSMPSRTKPDSATDQCLLLKCESLSSSQFARSVSCCASRHPRADREARLSCKCAASWQRLQLAQHRYDGGVLHVIGEFRGAKVASIRL